MRLIPLDKEILINPEQISYIEQKKKGIVVCVSGKEFDLDMPIEMFIGILDKAGMGGQRFGG